MNKRIKELARQAYIEDGYHLDSHYKLNDFTEDVLEELDGTFQRFAELIIKECKDQCEQVAVDADITSKSEFVTENGKVLHSGMWGGAKSCIGRITSHFEIEKSI